MKKAEVRIGGKYYAKVTNKRVEIQIESVNADGGWNAINLVTGKKVHIKSAERLLGVVEVPKRQSKVKVKVSAAKISSEPEANNQLDVAPTAVQEESAKNLESEVTPDAPTESKLSCVTAAWKVLTEASAPLNAQEMIAAMVEKGYWISPGGKTPHATLYSAILRELAKGDASRFIKAERGRFAAKAK